MKKKLNNRFTAAEKINLNNYITVNFQQINKMEPSVSWSDLAANIKKLIKVTVTAPYLATIFNARAKTVRTLLVKRPILNSTKSLSKGSDKLDTNTSLVANLTKKVEALEAALQALLTPKEAAAFFQVSESTLWRIAQSGDLSCVKIGRKVRYKMDDLVRYIDGLRSESINRNLMKKGAVVTEPKTNKALPTTVISVNEQDVNKFYSNLDNKPNSDLGYIEADGVGAFGFRRD